MKPTRFEIALSPERRRALEEFAEAAGMSSAAVARFAIARLLNERASLLRGQAIEASAA